MHDCLNCEKTVDKVAESGPCEGFCADCIKMMASASPSNMII